jgi:hypothetical protein
MLVIDGKYNNDDGLSTAAMINRQIEDKSRKIGQRNIDKMIEGPRSISDHWIPSKIPD